MIPKLHPTLLVNRIFSFTSSTSITLRLMFASFDNKLEHVDIVTVWVFSFLNLYICAILLFAIVE